MTHGQKARNRWSIRPLFLIAMCVLIIGVWAWASSIPRVRVDVRSEPDHSTGQKREQEDLRAHEVEIERRRSELVSEIARLDMDHPWAGRYYAGDGMGMNIFLLLAPRGGCLATWRGCMGLYGCNWGAVTVDDGRLHVEFTRPNTPGKWGNFDCDFTIVGCGENRFLQPPGQRDVLRLDEAE
jgi:hypothetical protein